MRVGAFEDLADKHYKKKRNSSLIGTGRNSSQNDKLLKVGKA
jgi:hypothetical protein